MYQILSELKVTYISVGHRPSLLKYHDKKLILRGPGIDVETNEIAKDSLQPALVDLTAR